MSNQHKHTERPTHGCGGLGCDKVDAEEGEWWDVKYVWNRAERPPTPERYREQRRHYLRQFDAEWAVARLVLDEAAWLMEDAAAEFRTAQA